MLATMITILGIGLFLIAAYGDAIRFQISNQVVLAIGALGIARLIFIGDLAAAAYTISVTVVIFFLLVWLFSRKMIGGGDAKLLTASILLIGYQDLNSFLISMSVAGAGLSLLVLIRHRRVETWRQLPVPYGVAIAAAGIITLFSQSSFLG